MESQTFIDRKEKKKVYFAENGMNFTKRTKENIMNNIIEKHASVYVKRLFVMLSMTSEKNY